MKLFFSAAAALLLFVAAGTAQNRSIQFQTGKWSEILAKAKQENKPLFVDAYTVWCGPCKWLAKNIFTNDKVADFYNNNFVCVKINMEEGEGIELAKKWGVRGYPTLLYFNNDGEIMHRTCGVDYSDDYSSTFIQLGKDALNPTTQFLSLKKYIEKGDPNPEYYASYVYFLANSCQDYKTELTNYFITQKPDELLLDRNWKLISELDLSMDSREFMYLKNNREAYIKKYGAENVYPVFEQTYAGALKNSKTDDKRYSEIKSVITADKGFNSDKLILSSDIDYYQHKKDWNNYTKTAELYLTQFAFNNPMELNNIAWSYYENINDPAALEKAVNWAKKSTELNPGYASFDTYAHLLMKTGKYAMAKTIAEKAIELAKKNGNDYSGTEQLLNKLNSK